MKVSTGNAATPSAAMHLSSDPGAQFHLLQRVHEATLSGSAAPAAPRSVISESWQRSLAAHVDPDDVQPPVVYAPDEIADVRSEHPLHNVLPTLREHLLSIADESQHVMIVTDAQGTILWREGPTELCMRADAVGLRAGAGWGESSIGTNAMGTALAVGGPVQIYSAEHLVRTYHSWTCAAAPIHDPDSGNLLGAIDISGHLSALHPALVSLVNATAQLTEVHLLRQMELGDELLRNKHQAALAALGSEPNALLTPSGRVVTAEPHGPWPNRISIQPGMDRVLLNDGSEATVEPLQDGYLLRMPRRAVAAPRKPSLSLSLFGPHPVASLDGRQLPLTLRRAEILTLLALHPAGLTAEQLAAQLYGDHGNPTTVRAEVHRLRTQLGDSVMPAKPYRLRCEVAADFLTARSALRGGDVTAAAAACTAPLLATSESPAIRAERDQLDAALRTAVLQHDDADVLWLYSQHEPGCDDIEVFEQLVDMLPAGGTRRSIAAARLACLLNEDA